MCIGGQAADAHQGEVVHFEDPLEVAIERLHLHTEAGISANCDAVLASDGHERTSVVFK